MSGFKFECMTSSGEQSDSLCVALFYASVSKVPEALCFRVVRPSVRIFSFTR